jgi:hypothetical protein
MIRSRNEENVNFLFDESKNAGFHGNVPEKSFLEAGKVKPPWRKEAPKTNAWDIMVISWRDIKGRLSG